MEAFDQRIVSVGLEINGEVLLLDGVDIRASGYANTTPTAATATIVINNLTKEHRNYILTKSTPIAKQGATTPTRVYLDVGRESYGTFRIFDGTCWAMGATQPPDIGIILDGTINDPVLALIASVSFAGLVPLSVICKKVSEQLGLRLEFKVKNDKNISNYNYTGSAAKQVQKLAAMGDVKAYIAENKTLVVIDADQPRSDVVVKINKSSGMVGVPQAMAKGVIVKTLINNNLKIGNDVEISSEINPSVNGKYRIETMQFDVSNRQNEFFYTLFCTNLFEGLGTQ